LVIDVYIMSQLFSPQLLKLFKESEMFISETPLYNMHCRLIDIPSPLSNQPFMQRNKLWIKIIIIRGKTTQQKNRFKCQMTRRYQYFQCGIRCNLNTRT
jgi:hypothetical protein